jgi:PrtD family type I secretion system ABC transporter
MRLQAMRVVGWAAQMWQYAHGAKAKAGRLAGLWEMLSAAGTARRGVAAPVACLALLSAGTSVLYLTSSFFMLEVYDRVIPSRSIPTLVALCIIAVVLYAFQGLFDTIRGRILLRVGSQITAELGPAVFDAIARMPLRSARPGDAVWPLRDLDQIRTFVASGGPNVLFDLPWIPVYLVICFGFHPLIGAVAVVGAFLLVALALVAEIGTRKAGRAASLEANHKFALASAVSRNAEVVHALGMGAALRHLWEGRHSSQIQTQNAVADVGATIAGATKVLRMALQSAVLAVGAWLVIEGQASGGIIIAASILSSRALAPVELAIAHWKGFTAARQSWTRLANLLAEDADSDAPTELPRPEHALSVQKLSGRAPGGQKLLVHDVSFSLRAGQALGIIGPSGSGKSSLARMIVGVWSSAAGSVRLDGAALDQWQPEQLGRHLGYLPQDVELFGGSVVRNIARFDPAAKAKDALAAAKAAGVHDLILTFPQGYSTELGENGTALSAGQRQRIALARALYGDPFLVVLDEPNSNLDAQGEEALTAAILGIRARGGIAIVIAHRASALAGCDLVAAMAEGRMVAFGPKDEVLRSYTRGGQEPVPARPAAAQVVGLVPGHGRAAAQGGQP